MSDVLGEVREAMKQERMEKFWKQYGGLIITVLVLIVLSTAANEGYKAWKSDRNKDETAQFLAVYDKDDHVALLEETDALQDGLKVLAQMKAAGEFARAGDSQKALEIYTDIQKNAEIRTEFRQLAEYNIIRLTPNTPADQKILALSRIWEQKDNPWGAHARLDAAVTMVHELKNYDDALAQLELLKNNEMVPKSLRQKATSLDILYRVQQNAAEN